MTLEKKWVIGGVYKVKRRKVVMDLYPKLPEYYYCTIIKNPNKEKPNYNNDLLHTYIPNEISRPFVNNWGGCELDSRMEYLGSFHEYGHLLFNQKLQWHKNEYNTNMTYKGDQKKLI